MTALRHRAMLLAVTALLVLFSIDGRAQTYPSKPVRYLSGASTASGGDMLGRLFAAELSQVFGQQVVVENRPGAGGNLVAELAAKAPPDGYTILQVTAAYAGYASLYRNLAYDLIRDFASVTQIATGPYVVVVHPSLPAKSIGELIKLAKAKSGAIDYSSAGAGGPTFIAAELFKAQAGVDLLHVPYKGGGPALTAVIAGEVSVHFPPVATALLNVRERRLRALGVTTARRVPMMPELPTVAESGLSGYESGNWYGLLVPAKTPRETIAMIRSATVSVLNNATLNKRLNDLGFVSVSNQPEEFAAYITREIERVGKIVRAFNLTPD
jgi:tripartite-type tricarboxylate transporter receptor subunit TctC